MRVHTYVIATDAGSAPNYEPPIVTLAVCKPRIRKKATVGEVVIAFAGHGVNPAEPHGVVWAGIVGEKLTFAEYWRDKRFRGKRPDKSEHPDNFYRPVEGGLLWVENPVHGSEATEKDTGGQYVLVFSKSWIFREYGPVMPAEFGLRMQHGRRGERVSDLSEAQWKRLQAWLERQPSVSTTDARSTKRCSPNYERSVRVASQRRGHC